MKITWVYTAIMLGSITALVALTWLLQALFGERAAELILITAYIALQVWVIRKNMKSRYSDSNDTNED